MPKSAFLKVEGEFEMEDKEGRLFATTIQLSVFGNGGLNTEYPTWDSTSVVESSKDSVPTFPSLNPPANIEVSNLEAQPSLEVVLFHKPKGSKGLWKRVENGDKLRVTKGNGKRLKLQITSMFHFDRDSLLVRLLDLDLKTFFTPEKEGDSFCIEHANIHDRTVEIGLKIFRMGGRLCFHAQVQGLQCGPLSGSSSEFIAYTSGSTHQRAGVHSSATAVPANHFVPTAQAANQAPQTHPQQLAQTQHQNSQTHQAQNRPNAFEEQQMNSQPPQQNTAQQPSLLGHLPPYVLQMQQHHQQQIQHMLEQQQLRQLHQIQQQKIQQHNSSQNVLNNTGNNTPRQNNGQLVNLSNIALPQQILDLVRPVQQNAAQTATPVNVNASHPMHPNYPHHSNSGSAIHRQSGENPFPEIKMEPGNTPNLSNDLVTTVPGSLEIRGVARAKAFIQFSDIRLKTNIADLVDAMTLVTSLQGKSYEWKEDASDSNKSGAKRVIGLIAQEVQRVLPEVVHEDSVTGILSVSYAEILPVLIEAFKEFLGQYRVDKQELQLQVADLQSQLQLLSGELDKTHQNHQHVQQLVSGVTKSSKTLLAQTNEAGSPEQNCSDSDSKTSDVSSSKSSNKKKRRGLKRRPIPVFCRILQLVFAAFLAMFTICGVVGIVIAVSNSNNGNMFADAPQQNSGQAGYDQYDSQDFSVDFDNDYATKHNHRILGLTLFEIGCFGVVISGFGVCYSSAFLCVQKMMAKNGGKLVIWKKNCAEKKELESKENENLEMKEISPQIP
eukprot:TRINITY_DN2377_c0_g1_i1.p1 TRINITY_DN2377_c0_g1~~TRINITY_DN2377_c0_g1_i1.p1  ORF type:complete len:776 (+),score=206.62 TRINITY_DN2377_c0_g1_i1:2458-4785(+)